MPANGDDHIDLSGSIDNEKLIGGSGDDVLIAGSGNDRLVGGSGDDLADGGAGVDNMNGGSGDDNLSGGDGEDTLLGGSGDDTISGGENNDVIRGGSGHDVLAGNEGTNIIDGQSGDDTITAGAGFDTVYGVSGIDTLILEGAITDYMVESLDDGSFRYTHLGTGAVVVAFDTEKLEFTETADTELTVVTASEAGSEDTEYVVGSAAPDVIDSEGGDDIIASGDGNDDIQAGAGNDTVSAGRGDDVVDTGDGNDTITYAAGDGNDLIDGGDGEDELIVTADEISDQFTITAGAGDTSPDVAGGGVATITGTEQVTIDLSDTDGGEVTIAGDFSNTGLAENTIYITGSDSDDVIDAEAIISSHRVSVSAGAGTDVVLGGAGADTIDGAGGDDEISGGTGADILIGGAGNDIFLGSAADWDGDVIADYTYGEAILIEGASLDAADYSLIYDAPTNTTRLEYDLDDAGPGGFDNFILLSGDVAGTIEVQETVRSEGTFAEIVLVAPPEIITETITFEEPSFVFSNSGFLRGDTSYSEGDFTVIVSGGPDFIELDASALGWDAGWYYVPVVNPVQAWAGYWTYPSFNEGWVFGWYFSTRMAVGVVAGTFPTTAGTIPAMVGSTDGTTMSRQLDGHLVLRELSPR